MAQESHKNFPFRIYDDSGCIMEFTEASGLLSGEDAGIKRKAEKSEKNPKKGITEDKAGTITLKHGIYKAGSDFGEWLSNLYKTTDYASRDFMIQLMDEKMKPVRFWKIHKAIPVKIEGPLLNAETNEVAIESIELSFEELTIN